MEAQLQERRLLPQGFILFPESLVLIIDSSKLLLHDALALPDLPAVLLVLLPCLLLQATELILHLVDFKSGRVTLNTVLVGGLSGIGEFESQITDFVIQVLHC